ncbi:hypothetical protein ACP275_02G180000 [Erythranthe tilingii]
MGLESDLKELLSGIPKKIKKEEEFVDSKKIDIDEKLNSENRLGNVNASEEQSGEEDSVSRKRKRKCYLEMLNWIRDVAKDPCCAAIGSLPERQKWKHYGSELQWKQILLVREAMLSNKNVDAKSQQSIWQKKQKMHPSIYEDNDQSNSERLRYSQRLISAKDSSRRTCERFNSESSSSGFLTDEENDSTADSPTYLSNHRSKKRVRVGPIFQADLPQLSELNDYQSDSKWLGTKTWPLDKAEPKKSLIERDPIGKGKQESCGCQFSGSFECVKFHINEKRMKLKLELGSAFYRWKFNEMGDDVASSWTKEEEKKFRDIVESNRLSSEKHFWDELFKFFNRKGREALVSYYFNVFLLRRRGFQNRSNAAEIDSDDEESEFGPIGNRFGQSAANSPGSIFRSPKKSH